MPDTIIVSTPQEIQAFLDSLPDSLRASVEQIMRDETNHKDVMTPESIGITFGYLLLVILAFLIIVKIIRLLRPPVYNAVAEDETATDETGTTYYLYNGYELGIKESDIQTILAKHFPYYPALLPDLQQRFIKRVKKFMHVKAFIIPKDETYKEVPVLLSAAAVQLTFGLDDFELPWFRYIRVHAEEYFANDPNALRILVGHVEDNIITVAWSHFLKGIKDDNDGVNVGLHELAHALYYQHVIAHKGSKGTFITELSEVMEESEEIYELRHRYNILYSDYAYKNLQEFWAESIELFFEKSAAMQTHYPDLYETLKELLNQDPLNKTNPLLPDTNLKL
jgi:MtfA peptidase